MSSVAVGFSWKSDSIRVASEIRQRYFLKMISPRLSKKKSSLVTKIGGVPTPLLCAIRPKVEKSRRVKQKEMEKTPTINVSGRWKSGGGGIEDGSAEANARGRPHFFQQRRRGNRTEHCGCTSEIVSFLSHLCGGIIHSVHLNFLQYGSVSLFICCTQSFLA